ncbi:hypothetical protein J6590_104174 [Homalodisca vitripennis]|nr:hypothetical protein J6590_104174 [Homalodisca vitripennis]
MIRPDWIRIQRNHPQPMGWYIILGKIAVAAPIGSKRNIFTLHINRPRMRLSLPPDYTTIQSLTTVTSRSSRSRYLQSLVSPVAVATYSRKSVQSQSLPTVASRSSRSRYLQSLRENKTRGERKTGSETWNLLFQKLYHKAHNLCKDGVTTGGLEAPYSLPQSPHCHNNEPGLTETWNLLFHKLYHKAHNLCKDCVTTGGLEAPYSPPPIPPLHNNEPGLTETWNLLFHKLYHKAHNLCKDGVTTGGLGAPYSPPTPPTAIITSPA